MKFKVDWVENLKTREGKPFKRASIDDGAGNQFDVSVWPDFSQYESVTPGSEVDGVIRTKGAYKNLVDGNLGKPPAAIASYLKEKSSTLATPHRVFIEKVRNENIQRAMDRKETAIAYHNAVNNAVALTVAFLNRENVVIHGEDGGQNVKEMDVDDAKELIRSLRDWFLDEWSSRSSADVVVSVPEEE